MSLVTFSAPIISSAAEISPHIGISKHPSHVAVKGSLYESELGKAIQLLGDPTVSRTVVLKRFQTLADAYLRAVQPQTDASRRQISFVFSTVQILGQMVKEDEAHAVQNPKSIAKQQASTQITELLYKLRDQAPDTFGVYDGRRFLPTSNTADVSLYELGYLAVPRLLNALSDQRFTRGLKDEGDTDDITLLPVRVRDYALGILCEIAHRRLWAVPGQIGGSTFNPKEFPRREEKDWAPTITRANAWWAEVQQKGELRTVIEDVESGSEDAVPGAEWLTRAYPEYALVALARGAACSHNDLPFEPSMPYLQRRFTEALSGSAAVDIIGQTKTTQLKRITDAVTLGLTDPELELKALIKEWRDVITLPHNVQDQWALGRLMILLVHVDRPQAIEEIETNLRFLTGDQTEELLIDLSNESFGWRFRWSNLRAPIDESGWKVRGHSIERLLAFELTNTGKLRWGAFKIGYHPDQNRLERICDFAAALMADIWPEKYRFDRDKLVADRDLEILKCLEAFRHP